MRTALISFVHELLIRLRLKCANRLHVYVVCVMLIGFIDVYPLNVYIISVLCMCLVALRA